MRCLAAAGVLAVVAAALEVLVLTIGAGADAWWSHAGQTVAAAPRSQGQDPCDLIVGPARDYCERDASLTPPAGDLDVAGAVWRLVPAGAGLTALLVGRRRNAGAGRGRR
ncbi:hypothetical protein ACFU9Y_00880 [Streptomyces sp. NPDC057621]|uniref:hypothetical protein n=1 Tax=Streptomyces sp. NPDC057621 TaxID=3346186 RepID=UPI00369C6296